MTLKALYLHYHNAYGCKTSQVGVMPQGALTHKFASPFNEVLMKGHVILYILYILYIRLKRSHGYHNGQDADLQLEAPILKVI